MTTLGQIVGIHKSTKEAVQRDFDTVYHTLQKGDLFNGLERSQEMFDGFGLPQAPEKKQVQANATEVLQALPTLLTRLYDLEATKDYGDTKAAADIIVDGETVLPQVPINHLLWLEKQVNNLVTVFRSIPVPSAAEDWQSGQGLPRGFQKTVTEEQPLTKKVTDFQVVWQPTGDQKQSPEIRETGKDVQAGVKKTTKYTAALPAKQKEILINRAQSLLDGIRKAIPIANQLTVTDVTEGEALFNFLYDGVL